MHVELDRDGDGFFKVVVTGTPREIVLRTKHLAEVQKAGRVKAALLRIPLINLIEDRVQSVLQAQRVLEDVR